MFVLIMESEEYGSEEFKYDTMEEAMSGLVRLKAKIKELKDGIVRKLFIEEA